VYWESKARWDEPSRQWEGEARVSLMHPQYFGCDPEAESIEEASYVYCKRRARVTEMLAKYPAFKEAILAAAGEERNSETPFSAGPLLAARTANDADAGVGAPDDGRLVNFLRTARQGRSGGNQGGEPTHVTILECYFRDDSFEHVVEQAPVPLADLVAEGGAALDPATHQVLDAEGLPLTAENWPTRTVREYDRPLYPNGRVVLRVGDVILNPKPEQQRYMYAHWPFCVCVNYMLPHVWVGMNGVELAKGEQDWINVSLAHMVNYIKCFADPVTVVEQGTMQDDPDTKKPSRLANYAGAVWRVLKGRSAGIRREPPPPMSPSIPQFFEIMLKQARDQTGMQEIGLGKPGRPNTTAREATELATMSRLRTSLQSKLEDAWQLQIMQLVAEMNQRRLTPGQTVRIVGPKGVPGVRQIEQRMLDVRYDLKLNAATNLPFDVERKQMQYGEAYKLVGPAMLPEMLDVLGIDEKDSILERFDLWQQFQQFIAQQQALQQQAAQQQQAAAEAAPEPLDAGQIIARAQGAQGEQLLTP
jgi:hypothetical protein